MTRCAVILAAFLVVAGAFNKAEAGDYKIHGAGLSSCGKWTKDRNEGGMRYESNTNWFSGYITAFNTWGPYGPFSDNQSVSGISDITEGIDANGLVAWIDKWCRANPLESMDAAARNLIYELAKRKAN